MKIAVGHNTDKYSAVLEEQSQNRIGSQLHDVDLVRYGFI